MQESRQLLQQAVVTVLYYLSVMSVSKYNSILQTTEREEQSRTDGEKECDPTMSASSTISLGSCSLDPTSANAELTNSKTDVELSLETSEVELSFTPQREQAQSILQVPAEQSLVPTTFTLHAHALDISEQVEAAMELTGPFICQLLLEHKSLLSKVLVGADGKSLLTDGEEEPLIFCYGWEF